VRQHEQGKGAERDCKVEGAENRACPHWGAKRGEEQAHDRRVGPVERTPHSGPLSELLPGWQNADERQKRGKIDRGKADQRKPFGAIGITAPR
jgi:hypothetical protein